MSTRFGNYRLDTDPGINKDFKTSLAPTLKASGSGDPDLRPYCTPTHQWSLSACAGNATADSVEILDALDEAAKAKKESRKPLPTVQLARLFVYAKARELHQELSKDQGTYISSCFEVLSRFGICSEQTWPYDTSKVFVTPSIKALREATGHKIHSYYRISETGSERVDAVLTALRAYHPVVFGTLIPAWFGQWNGTDVINHPKDKEPLAGGHAMILVGWSSAKSAFIVKNSWGTAWGDRGYWYMSPEYLAWNNTWDLWVPTRGYSFIHGVDETTVTIIKS
jgi:C1A family cysteine protease